MLFPVLLKSCSMGSKVSLECKYSYTFLITFLGTPSSTFCHSNYQPRSWRRSCSGIVLISSPGIAAPSSFETSNNVDGFLKVCCSLDDGTCSCFWIRRLEDTRSYKNALGTKLHHKRSVGWGSYSTRQKNSVPVTPPCSLLFAQLPSEAPRSFAAVTSSSSLRVDSFFISTHNCSHMSYSFYNISRTSFSLGTNHSGTFANSSQSFP